MEKHWRTAVHRNICDYFFEARNQVSRVICVRFRIIKIAWAVQNVPHPLATIPRWSPWDLDGHDEHPKYVVIGRQKGRVNNWWTPAAHAIAFSAPACMQITGMANLQGCLRRLAWQPTIWWKDLELYILHINTCIHTTLAKKIESTARTWHRRVICRACTRLCLACVPVSIFLARVVYVCMACMCIHTCVHACTHTYLCALAHTCIHTATHTNTQCSDLAQLASTSKGAGHWP